MSFSSFPIFFYFIFLHIAISLGEPHNMLYSPTSKMYFYLQILCKNQVEQIQSKFNATEIYKNIDTLKNSFKKLEREREREVLPVLLRPDNSCQ